MGSDNSIINDITEKMSSSSYDDERIDASLAVIGESLDLSYIAVKEIVSENHILCCTYEWSKDGKRELLNTESRISDDIWERWLNGKGISSSGYLEWNANMGVPCPLKQIRKSLAGSIMHVQLFNEENLIGCVDFVDNRPKRRWTNADKTVILKFKSLLSEYLSKWHENKKTITSEIISSVYDHTTRLPKYELFCMEVEESFKELENSQLVILSVDFTNFKFINEKYGHEEGDLFLETVAKNIYAYTKWLISCCRSHSDNLLLVCKCDRIYTKARIINTIEEISRDFVSRISEKYFDCNLCINIGVHIIRSDTENIEQCISNANLARKYAKKKKHEYGHSCLTYDPAMAFELKRKAEYISDMKKGIEGGEFFLEFQPQVMTDNMEIIGAEALIRWKKDNYNRLMPEDFLSIFEKDGCIVKMDYYVYEQVFKMIHDRIQEKKPLFPISINVSIVHFYDNKLIPFIDSLKEKYNIPASYINFEIDERIAVMKMDNVAMVIDELRSRGFRVYIDNFGSGYSALNTLTRLNVDGIKIGRTLMKKDLDKTDQVIIQCVINMGNKLSLEVIAEGVETQEQRAFLIKSSCDYMQGNYFSRPLSIEALDALLVKQGVTA